jgi:hypothetical protein
MTAVSTARSSISGGATSRGPQAGGATSAFFALFLDFGPFGQRQDATIKPHLSRLRCDGRHAGLGVWLEGADILRIETAGCSIGDPTLGWFDVRFWETDPQTSQLRHGWLGTPCR